MRTIKQQTVFMWPKSSKFNKYSDLLTQSIESAGLPVLDFNKDTCLKPRRNDIVHFHWPSYSYRGSSFMMTLLKSFLFASLLLYYRVIGVQLFWTVHNVWPHNVGRTKWDLYMRKFILRQCKQAFVMSEAVRAEVVETFGVPKEKLAVIPHGHYLNVYASKGMNIREHFGIAPDRFVFMFVGRICAYKGIENLVQSVAHMKNEKVTLLIAGKVDSDFSLDFIDAYHDDRIHIHPQFIDDQDLADYLHAADVVVLPYTQITTSGSAILAMSHYKPIVAPRLGSLEEYIPAGCGILYEPEEPSGLKRAMEQAVQMNMKDVEGKISEKLKELDWHRIAGKMIGVYNGKKRYEVNV